MREYNVILKKDIDYDEFWNDMESDTDGGKLYIPNRKVEFTNERPASLRQCWYLLTDEEAEQLKLDERVFDVEIPPEHRTDIQIGLHAQQNGVFTKTTSDSGNFQNWGLIRSNNPTNVYGSALTSSLSYLYTLDGTGVDVVIQDSGIEVVHPEWEDASGNSRLQLIDWAVESGLAFTQNANHYRDYDGHGTHCAGIACGKTFGWAKNARIYSQKLSGLEGTGDSGTGVDITYAFDAIKNWHNNKPINPLTGKKRPTVVNMSWGYYTTYSGVTSVTYRGTTYTDGNTTGNSTYRSTTYGILNNSVLNVRISSVDTDIQELIDAGIVVCIAAGNRSYKIDVSSGTDYDNNLVSAGSTKYYHRGSSPYDDQALMVGNADSTVYSSTLDQKAQSSETGPGVDLYAPGTDIMSACSNTNRFNGQSYYPNSNYKQCNISGTSMASPQVAGVAALVLQANPIFTPAQVKSFILSNATSTIYSTALNNDWSDNRSIKGGAQKYLFSKYNTEKTLSVNNVTFAGVSFRTR